MQYGVEMKIVRYSRNGQTGWGICQDSPAVVTPLVHTIASFPEMLVLEKGQLSNLAAKYAAEQLPLAELSLLPPVTPANKIFCVGFNYGRHAVEAGRELPSKPSLFLRHYDSFVGAGEAVIKPRLSDQFDYEGELVIVIGKGGRHIAEADAKAHVAGYTCMAENSVRDFQKHATQVTAGKNFSRSGAIGPWITPVEDVPYPPKLQVATRLNGKEVQNGNTDEFVFSVAFLVSYISQFAELKPGDLIATGTPAGIGMKRNPPLYLRAGDELEVEIEMIGTLGVSVVNED